MSKTVCIYPQNDDTTFFLRPLCDHVCSTFDAKEVNYCSSDIHSCDKIFDEIKDAETIFFLGHGESTCLYASISENSVALFNKENSSILKNKKLFLLACNSGQFIKNCDFHNAIGFGFLPTSLYDARHARKLHSLRIEHLKEDDIKCYNNSLVNALIKTLSVATLTDFFLLKERLKFNISREIVHILLEKGTPNYRMIADVTYYIYKDLTIC